MPQANPAGEFDLPCDPRCGYSCSVHILDQFKGLGPFSAWLGLALAAGVALFYAWDLLSKRAQSRAQRELHGKPAEDKPAESRSS
jgi:hypothetical protein